MKPAKINKTILAPTSWEDIPFGVYYRRTLEHGLKTWWPKLFGFHLLKIGALSADLDTSCCAISHQINVGLNGKYLHVIADPYQLPFANKSADACLLAHTLSYSVDPHRLLREVDRVLIDDGWLITTTFNPVSLLGLRKMFPILFKNQPYRSRMYTHMRLLDWLGMLNFEVLYRTCLQVLPWRPQGGRLLSTHCPAIGCLSVIISRKRTLPLSLTLLKKIVSKQKLQRPINVTTCSYR
ncbi:class I SAM-dependent methyltransferase [Sodalis endosymbiont of Henestaris halophilus]|uniref:class I SAM-dependent methyltransferase n=1 Tax=Sodalis endosymbiont of Henestaris halophilus TaxID=1929246 RepID=UPI000BC0C2E0|nr:class I SAM-dependent methyltransferase [Sodalis endosymbiont of Henestaris halophilus]SNC58435.1 Methyltransferase type 11 [Sodalis endosymbiont of Henestaris halophilus]